MEINIWILTGVGVAIFGLLYVCLASIYKLILRVTALEKKLQLTISNVIRIQNTLGDVVETIYRLDELKTPEELVEEKLNND